MDVSFARLRLSFSTFWRCLRTWFGRHALGVGAGQIARLCAEQGLLQRLGLNASAQKLHLGGLW